MIQDSYNGVHFIKGQEQTSKSNGFDKYWHDITDVINIYRQKISGTNKIIFNIYR